MSDPNIRIKRSSVPGKRPEISQVEMGELALNTNDGRLFTRKYNVGIGSTVTLLNVFTENIGGGAYYNDGNIGIGTELPSSKLTVIGDGSFTGIITAAGFDGGPLSGSSGNFTSLYVSGVSTFASPITGTISTATALETPRTFEITGDIVGSPISFDGTGNVSIAATIQPNSVALGNDTTGNYVASISGTANEIEITGGTGESSTPQVGLPNDVVISNNLVFS